LQAKSFGSKCTFPEKFITQVNIYIYSILLNSIIIDFN
jgi:hypothetical protein